MEIFLLSGVVLFGSFLANALLLQRLATFLSRKLWQVTPPASLQNAAAGVDHILAAIITAAVFSLQWRDHPVSAVISALSICLLLLCGGIIRLLLLTRRQMLQVEAPQFDLQNKRLYLLQSERPPGPLYCRLHQISRSAAEKYPRSFSAVRIELYAPGAGLVAYNTYYDHLQAAGILAQLQRCKEAAGFDRALVGRNPQGHLFSVRLGHNWIPLLCGPLKELPPHTRAWWQQLLCNPAEETQEIHDTGFMRFLRPLFLAAENEKLLQTSFAAEFVGLEQLLKAAEGPLQLIPGEKITGLIPSGYAPRVPDSASALVCWQASRQES